MSVFSCRPCDLGTCIRAWVQTGQYWSSGKKAGQPTAEGFIPPSIQSVTLRLLPYNQTKLLNLKCKISLSIHDIKDLVRKYCACIANLVLNITFMVFHIKKLARVCARWDEEPVGFHLFHFLPFSNC